MGHTAYLWVIRPTNHEWAPPVQYPYLFNMWKVVHRTDLNVLFAIGVWLVIFVLCCLLSLHILCRWSHQIHSRAVFCFQTHKTFEICWSRKLRLFDSHVTFSSFLFSCSCVLSFLVDPSRPTSSKRKGQRQKHFLQPSQRGN